MYLTALRLSSTVTMLSCWQTTLSWGKDLYQALYRMEALEHQAGILFRTLILAYITGHDVPYLSGEALAGLVQIRDEMGILTGGIPEN